MVRMVKSLFPVLALLLLSAAPAHAQKVFEQFSKPMPTIELAPPTTFDANTTLFEEPALGDPALAYSIRLPKDWTLPSDTSTVRLSSENNIIGEIGRYYGPPMMMEQRSTIEIHALGLDFQMSAQEWLMQYMLQQGYNFQGMEVHNDKKAEALYVLLDKGESYCVRALAVINGRRVILLQYFIPIERWHDEKAMQAQVVKSFDLKHIDDEAAEPMDSYKFLDISVLNYPKTWKLNAPPIKTIERMGARLLNLATVPDDYKTITKMDGKIDAELVSIYSTDTLEDEMEQFRAALEKSSLSVQDFIESPDDFVLNPVYDFAETNVYKASDSGNQLIEYEFWQTVLSAGEYYYFITLLTPARDQDYFIWLRNVGAYKLVLNNIEPRLDSIEQEDEAEE